MSAYHVRFTESARDELLQLYAGLLTRDPDLAAHELYVIRDALRLLEHAPATCRQVAGGAPHAPLRELSLPLGATGCVALFTIDDESTVTVLAVRSEPEPGR